MSKCWCPNALSSLLVGFFNSFTAIGDNNRLLHSLDFYLTFFANSINPDKTAHNEPYHLDLRCWKYCLSILHINFFPSNSLLKTDDKYRLKFGSERVK